MDDVIKNILKYIIMYLKMGIRIAQGKDIPKLLFLYQKYFPAHEIFSKSEGEILEYLYESHKENMKYGGGYFIYEFHGRIISSILLMFNSEDNGYKVWNIKHFFVDENYKNKEVDSEMISHIEGIVSSLSGAAKIKICLSYNKVYSKRELIEFYVKRGYVIMKGQELRYGHKDMPCFEKVIG